ncbi:hypothetical protein LTR56_012704 [Elasticomyces elasticus]|nr:hypothetical protein LTR22_022662 [Elasticomyces elasticus]KAK3638981.1 hypothetical protein LTR56_012704 [Elasticomyces elasticus]KAK5754406.1 hypothetical protein LTS12_015475 [Elasticomyces elasticus]
MLFFFDSNHAYVLAEATRTLSLQNDSVHDDEDDLWLGHTVIPRGFSICEETVARLPSGDQADPFSLSHIINDLDEDTQFCGRPYVVDGPKAKFYAGVPITTSKGINIGAYCCLDDKKRDGLDAKSIAFLHDMAKTVMTHLEHVRAKAEHERGTRMVSALGAFVEGAQTVQDWDRESARRNRGRAHDTPSSASRRSLSSAAADAPARLAPSSPALRSTTPTKSDSVIATVGNASPATESTKPVFSQVPRTTRQTNMQELQDISIAPNIRASFQRAANLILEAVDADGVAFLDSSANTYGGLVESGDGSDQSSSTPESAAEHEQTGSESEDDSARKSNGSGKACKVLASAHSGEDGYSTTDELRHDIQASSITERFLRSLLRRNPGGMIWTFAEDGSASSDDSSSEGSAKATKPPLKVSNNGSLNDTAARQATHKRRKRIDDGKEIQRLFPGVRSLALCGMWDMNRGRWYSACAVWTYSPLRVFSNESEVSYTAAFCDVIMAEVYRLEAQNSDKAKSDFISSLSHELRSPLHGILGSVECLQDIPSLDGFTSDLVSQVEVCGRTLSDIIEHLLDYSKINHQAKPKRHSRSSSMRSSIRSSHGDNGNGPQIAGLMSTESEIALDKVTEEVVESAVYSFCCAKAKDIILDRKVAVVLDVDREPSVRWQCRFPLDAWKRICINLVSNALKYTEKGFIRISLRADPIPGKRRHFNAVFMVQDTGRGMSKEYLDNHLFRAFSQENNLVEGTGLGMSLVAKILKALGGRIDVRSTKGKGTTMTVTCPLESKSSRDASVLRPAAKPFEGRSIGLILFSGTQQDATESTHVTAPTRLLRNSVQFSCEHLGIEARRSDNDQIPEADIYLVLEQDLDSLAHHKQTAAKPSAQTILTKPLIILCNSAISARQIRTADATTAFTTAIVEYIAQPCGTERLRKAIQDGLARSQDQSNAGEETASTAAGTEAERLREHGDIGRRSSQVSLRAKMLARTAAEHHQALHRARNNSPSAPQVQHPKVGSSSTNGPPVAGKDHPSSGEKLTGNSSMPTLDTTVQVKGSISMLLVDDNPINLQLLVTYAKKEGHPKITAPDGMQAVEAYKAACLAGDKPEVILMDISMPVMNGFEATRRIRKFEQQQGIHPTHIIALTGLGSAEAQQEAFSSGVDLYLTKPVRLKELTRVLKDLRSADETQASLPATPES